jgi:short-subunit dehydrogenase
VNNIEGFDPRLGKIHKASDQELVEITNINTFPMVMMSRFLGPQMVARGTHKSGIINMTSYYVDWPSYNLPLYVAGKSLQAHSSYTFGLEVEDKIDVLTVKQLPVKSERNPRGVEAKEVVEGVFNDLG